ncbi:metal-sensitive transcriptional regulator [Actinoplanes sp. NPDC049599]|uniref:metal-sensitive transcriptional regulator n=1 Tax=Actinoplanes sp. NPDC049599 TaxID=3363903 RepID=UPI0037B5503A
MDIDQPHSRAVSRRLRRAAGQLRGVIGMLESGRDHEAVLLQVAAVSHAVHRTAYLIIADQLRQCTADGDRRGVTLAEVERAFQNVGQLRNTGS